MSDFDRTQHLMSRTRHDLLQPAAAMRLLLSRMKDNPAAQEQDRIIHVLLAAIDQLEASVDALADYLYLSQGVTQKQDAELNVVEWFSEITQSFRPQTSKASLFFEVESETSVDMISSDKALLTTVLQAILSNAFEFTREGGITAELNVSAEKLEFSVVDTGFGLGELGVEDLFVPFVIDQSIYARNPSRFGLGLTRAKLAADILGGSLDLTPNAASTGMTATFSLPL